MYAILASTNGFLHSRLLVYQIFHHVRKLAIINEYSNNLLLVIDGCHNYQKQHSQNTKIRLAALPCENYYTIGNLDQHMNLLFTFLSDFLDSQVKQGNMVIYKFYKYAMPYFPHLFHKILVEFNKVTTLN